MTRDVDQDPGSGDESALAVSAEAKDGGEGSFNPHYLYWREHGEEWPGEYRRRKETQVLYHVQELMLSDYLSRLAPGQVLEFGCGTGRHLRHLIKLPGLELWGYDQSSSMVAGMRQWASKAWLDEHVQVGSPTGRLPYEDDQFDVVFSAEVLLHVNPDDLEGILGELMRVAKRQVLHLEPSQHFTVADTDPGGCWVHDLVSVYARLGQRCEILPAGCRTQVPYRVVLDGDSVAHGSSPVLLGLLRDMESDLQGTLTRLDNELRERNDELQTAETRVRALMTQSERLKVLVEQRVEAIDQLRRKLSQSRLQVQEKEAALAKSAAREEEREKKLQQVDRARIDALVEVRKSAERLRDAETQVSSLRSELDDAEERAQRYLRDAETQASALSSELDNAEERAQRYMREWQQTTREVEEVRRRGEEVAEVRGKEVEEAMRRAARRQFELEYTRRGWAYRFTKKLRNSGLYNFARWLKSRNRSVATVRIRRDDGNASAGEVRLLGASTGGEWVPWDFVETPGDGWVRTEDPRGADGEALVAKRGLLRVPLYDEAPRLRFLSQPEGGEVSVKYNGARERLALVSLAPKILDVLLDTTPMQVKTCPGPQEDPDPAPQTPGPGAGRKSPSLMSGKAGAGGWADGMQRERATVVAVHAPRWLGVSAATRNLFAHRYCFPEDPERAPQELDEAEIARSAQTLLDSGVEHFVFSGGDEVHFRLARLLKRRCPGVRCDLLWHGSYVQFVEDYSWKLVKIWVEGARQGIVNTVGTVKKGMEQFFERLGCRSRLVMNYVPEVPLQASTPAAGGPHVGLWISRESYRKLPFAMLSALKMIPNAVLHGSNFSTRSQEVIDFLQVGTGSASEHVLPTSELLEAIGRTHLSLYVTFSECCPMLPLESFSVGVPCLLGPTSHLFENDEYLHGRVVVPYPDRADVIADHISRCLEERDALVEAYRRWSPAYNEAAKRSVEAFLAA